MAQGITLAKAMQVFSQELGCGDDARETLIDEITSSIEFLMHEGGGDILKQWQVIARNGTFVLPRDLGTPLKFKYARLPAYGFGTFSSPYFSYGSPGAMAGTDLLDWDHYFSVKPNFSATELFPPCEGLRLVATTRNPKDVGKKIIVSGKQRGMKNVPTHMGKKTSGEVLTIYAEDDPHKKYGAWVFDEIDSVVKDETISYVMLSGVTPVDKKWYFLSHYHPDDMVPRYRVAEAFAKNVLDGGCDFLVHILGRINPSVKYTRDDDVLPINTLQMLKLLAKRARYDANGNLNELAAQERRIIRLIKKTVSYQQAPNRQLSFSLGGSGGEGLDII